MKKGIIALIVLMLVAGGIYYWFERGRQYDFMGNISYDSFFQTREYTGSLKAILPTNVLPVQLGKRYMAGGTIFQFVMQPSRSFPLADFNPMLQRIHFAGVLVYDAPENKFQKLLSIKPLYVGKGTGLVYNPVGLFKDEESLVIDLASDFMSGDTVGKVVRLSYNLTDKKRNQVGCYEYQLLNGNYSQGGLALPYSLDQSTGCVY